MTLKEKFSDVQDPYHDRSADCILVAEEFAIEFYNWMRINDVKENAEKYFHYTDRDMLNAFKEEQGL